MKKTNGQGHISGPGRAGGQPRSHSKDTRGSAWERGTRTGSMTLASQVGSKRCSRKTLEGCLVTTAWSQPSSRKGERRQMAGQVGRTAARPGRKGPAPLRPQRKPGDGEQPAPTPPAPQQLPQDRSWAPNPRSQGHTHGTPTTLMLGRGEPSRSRWLPKRAVAGQAAGSSGVRAGGASPGLGLSWTSPPAKPYTLLCQARTQECSRESREEPRAAP